MFHVTWVLLSDVWKFRFDFSLLEFFSWFQKVVVLSFFDFLLCFQQQLINYCLLVDKFVETEKFPVDATEQVVLLHSVNEDKSRKHLEVMTSRTVAVVVARQVELCTIQGREVEFLIFNIFVSLSLIFLCIYFSIWSFYFYRAFIYCYVISNSMTGIHTSGSFHKIPFYHENYEISSGKWL